MAKKTVSKKSIIAIRDGEDDDLDLIYSSWLKGLRFGSNWFKLIDQEAYFYCYHKVLEKILNKPTTRIKVACLVEDPSVVIGYSVFDLNAQLHWVFVKRRWRNIGICKDLLPAKVSVVTHVTKVGASLLAKTPGVKFDPFLI